MFIVTVQSTITIEVEADNQAEARTIAESQISEPAFPYAPEDWVVVSVDPYDDGAAPLPVLEWETINHPSGLVQYIAKHEGCVYVVTPEGSNRNGLKWACFEHYYKEASYLADDPEADNLYDYPTVELAKSEAVSMAWRIKYRHH
jgi:hypothetical protein